MSILIFEISCTENTAEKSNRVIDQKQDFEKEKAKILKVLNDETKAAFNRN